MPKISQYTDGGAVQSADKFVIERAGVNKSILGSQLGGGLTISSASVTTSNVTGVEGTLHNLDVSGMTANRDFNLPTPSAAGKRIGVRLSVGDATYTLLLKINAVEWSRIFITNEIVIFVSTGTSAGDWAVEQDGRIPCVTRIKNTGTQNISNNTVTTVVLDEADFDNASVGNTTLYRLTFRRSNKYIASGFAKIDNIAAATRVAFSILKNGTTNVTQDERSASAGAYPSAAPLVIDSFSAGDYIEMTLYHNSGSTEPTFVTGFITHLEIFEILA